MEPSSAVGVPNRVLKKSFSCFDRLSTNGKSPTIAMPAPFALSLSKGERRGFQYPLKLIAVSIMAQLIGQREGIHLMQPIGTVEDQLGPHRIGAQQFVKQLRWCLFIGGFFHRVDDEIMHA